MRHYFSKRHQEALKSGKLVPVFKQKLLNALGQLLNNYSITGHDGNLTFNQVKDTLKIFYGENDLLILDQVFNKVPAKTIKTYIDNADSDKVLDFIECFYDNLLYREPADYERDLNYAFEIHDSPWRIINGNVFLVDSDYLRNEVLAKIQYLMKDCSAEGALEEFQEALSHLNNDETKDAVVKAHKSVESVMKTVLNIKTHVKFGVLLNKLTKNSAIIPEYYDEFLQHFDKLALGAVKARNQPGTGHGQGIETTQVPRSLAEFAVNLAAVINLFLIKRWIELNPQKSQNEKTSLEDIDLDDIVLEELDEDKMPF